MAQALLSVLDPAGFPDPRDGTRRSWTLTPLPQVMDALVDHEAAWWRATRHVPGTGVADLTDLLARRVVALVCLLCPANRDDTVAILRRIPELAGSSAERRAAITDWVRRLYGSSRAVSVGTGHKR
ncbi:hypothetical protein [Nonomuraea sp. NPDC003709]|uniref:hypothetical protein n=1 Tax=Nonomuraea sp. NPDC003709 TaxID=3154450 RepID=UPI0033B57097